MKHFCALTLLLLFAANSIAQDWDFEKPDYEQIEKNIQIETSNLFYSSLMNRFQTGDTTLTIEEIRHLYYGFTFQPKYAPYGHSDYTDSIRTIFRKENLDSLDYDKLNLFCRNILKDNPFDFSTLEYHNYALSKMDSLGQKEIVLRQLNWLIDAVISSGKV